MSYSSPPPEHPAPANPSLDSRPLGENLPPVEPPQGGFLVQLFLVPAAIVTVLIVVWAMFTGLAQKGNDVEGYLRALGRDTPERWQAAVSLADLVRNSGEGGVRRDEKVAAELSAILQKELTAGRTDQKSLELRAYLCNALGEFRVPGLTPILEQAATQEKAVEEKPVRFAALKSLAVYVEANPSERADEKPLLAAIDRAAQDDEILLRSTAAFAYSALHSAPAQAGLTKLLHDRAPDVRYNAALMLARNGDLAAINELVDMLDPEVTVAPFKDSKPSDIVQQRASIYVNALRAVDTLAKAHPQADFAKLRGAVERLSRADVPKETQLAAGEVLRRLDHPELRPVN